MEMAEKEELKQEKGRPDPELLKRIRILQNLEMLEMMRELKLLKRKKLPGAKGEKR